MFSFMDHDEDGKLLRRMVKAMGLLGVWFIISGGIFDGFLERPNQSNVVINFNGQVVDDEMKPVAGAVVRGRVRQWAKPLGMQAMTRFEDVTTTSNEDGHFSFQNLNGNALIVLMIERAGYVSAIENTREFRYERIEGSEVAQVPKPAPFVLSRRAEVAKEVVRLSELTRLRRDGTMFIINPVSRSFNLTNAQDRIEVRFESIPGSLLITNRARPRSRPEKATPWRLTVGVPEGGVKLIPEDARGNSPVLVKAPEEGYAAVDSVEGMVSEYVVARIRSVEFYFFMGEPKVYGKGSLIIGPWDEDIWTEVVVETSVNPDGGRSLIE